MSEWNWTSPLPRSHARTRADSTSSQRRNVEAVTRDKVDYDLRMARILLS